jgi:hypothetical protein
MVIEKDKKGKESFRLLHYTRMTVIHKIDNGRTNSENTINERSVVAVKKILTV